MHTYSKDHMYKLCQKHLKQYVLIETNFGEKIDGVIIDLDDENVYLVVPVQSMEPMQHHYRQFGPYGGFGYGFGPYGYGFGYPGFRLRRIILPLTAIAALSLLPW